MPLDTEAHARLKEKVEEADLALALQTENGKTPQWAQAHIELADALAALAGEEEDRAAFDCYEQAISTYEQALEVYNKDDYLGEWGSTIVALARTLRLYALREGGDMSQLRLERAKKLVSDVMEALPDDEALFDKAMLSIELAYIYRTFADTDRSEKRLDHLRNTIAQFEEAARIFQAKERFDNWALAVVGQAISWREVASLDIEEPLHALYRSADLLKSALNYYNRDTHPADWVYGHFEYGRTFLQIANLSDGERCRDAASAAVDAIRVSLKSMSVENAPDLWLRLKIELAIALSCLAQAGARKDAPALLEEAASVYKMAANHYAEREEPIGVALMQASFGKELVALSNCTSGQESQNYRYQAINAMRKSISPVLEKERHAQWISNLIELGTTFHATANHEETENRTSLYEEAIEIYRQVLGKISSARDPELVARLQSWMGLALAYLGENDESDLGLRRLKESELAFRLSLKYYGLRQDSLDFIRIESNLGNLFYTLARRSDEEDSAVYTRHALKSMLRAIAHIDKEKTPAEWCTAHSNYGLALKHSIVRGFSTNVAEDCEAAVEAFREALSVQLDTQDVVGDLAIRRNLAGLLVLWGESVPSAAGIPHLQEALELLGEVRDWAQDNEREDMARETEADMEEIRASIQSRQPKGFFSRLFGRS